MTEVIKLKTGSKYEELNSYSRAVAVGDLIFVANTAGRNYRTREIADDVTGQCRQAFRNIEAALQGVGASLADVVRLRAHVPDPADMPAVAAFVGERMRGIDPAGTFICTPLASPEYKVEFEITAYRGAGAMPTQRVKVDI
jgi:enamine deaminase RidA (YjgF/YER057c/UK114 family)